MFLLGIRYRSFNRELSIFWKYYSHCMENIIIPNYHRFFERANFSKTNTFNQSLEVTTLAGARVAPQLTSEGICRVKSDIRQPG